MIDIFLALAIIVVFCLFSYQMWHVGLYFGRYIALAIVAFVLGLKVTIDRGFGQKEDVTIRGLSVFKLLMKIEDQRASQCQS